MNLVTIGGTAESIPLFIFDSSFIKFAWACIGIYTFMLDEEIEIKLRTNFPKSCYYIHEFKSLKILPLGKPLLIFYLLFIKFACDSMCNYTGCVKVCANFDPK